MRSLWLLTAPPWPLSGGGIPRIHHLVDASLRLGHAVDVWFHGDDQGWGTPAPGRLRLRAFPYGERPGRARALLAPAPDAALVCATPAMRDALRQLRREDFDVVVVERTFLGAILPELARLGTPWVLDADNVEASLAGQMVRAASSMRRRARLRIDALKVARQERLVVRAADLVVACSEPDRRRLAAIGARATAMHPNGVDLEAFPLADHAVPRGARVLFFGSLDYPPNADACRWLGEELWARVRERVPVATLALVGRDAPAAVRRLHDPAAGIEVVGEVPDIRAELAAADVVLVPLRMGSGTRLKALEAMASGVPLVSTRLGVEGLDVEPGAQALVADDPGGLADAVARALGDVELRRRLAAAARRHVEAGFGWGAIGEAFTATLARVTRGTA